MCSCCTIVHLQGSPYLSSLAFASVFPVSISLSVHCYFGVSSHAVGGWLAQLIYSAHSWELHTFQEEFRELQGVAL